MTPHSAAATPTRPASGPTAWQALNALPATAFTDRLADVFELSPWVAERAAPGRPYRDLGALHAAMCQVVRRASEDEQLGLLQAHPELAGREARDGALTAASQTEQAGIGLQALGAEDARRIAGLNAAYRQRHGFPFIACVGHHSLQSLLLEFQRRLHNRPAQERQEALAQVAAIARLRLERLFPA